MVTIRASAPINAPAAVVYDCLADYRQHHPHILPPAFSELEVLEGGYGAGTKLRFRLKLLGATNVGHGIASEPEPGRVLVEAYDNNFVTTFTVTPTGEQCEVEIKTESPTTGLRGLVERLLLPRALGPLYADELARLERYASDRVRGTLPAAALA